MKLQGEKVKIQDKVSIEDVQVWEADIEGEIDEADGEILRSNQYVRDAEAKSGKKMDCKNNAKKSLAS